MSLFQKSVVNKYLANLNSSEVTEAFQKFKSFYGDAERIENIKLLKEENYQEGFLREIFVQVLGYTINPDKNYNITTEYKNETDSKKADAAILKDSNAIGVIELKSTKTVNLESITNQAFNYKNHQPKCKYVITSNFEKLNFYIDNATEWQEFNLFTLTEKEFALFYLLLSAKNLLNDIPEKIKKESRLHEENISDKLYKDYSQFKHKIYNNLVKNNPQYEKLLLFKKSQKLLDRVLFVLFAEDSGLVPPNAISRIVDQFEQLKDLDEQKSLYSRFVKFFNHLNVGHTYKEFSLPAYNGGLFKADEILDNVHIDDEILLSDILKLSSYDFSTEVDVNILGHIFEHSLTEIEQLTAELEGTLVEREKTKRKKDGIFYTPKYITKYIVDNTIGALCNEKKKELNLYEIDLEVLENSRTAKGNLTAKAKNLFDNLELYRNYILSLKILDPACGSGAFLNQALEFLITEHKWIDERKASLLQEGFAISEFEKEIVEKNIYGVDINEEAVEIAKLSLWLRTAKKGRKLSTLSNNIKCGNSLIDDPEIAGDKAFNWNEEFREIMQNGGFDVVIGNPPYVSVKEILNEQKNYFKSNYISATGQFDLYVLFIEMSYNLLNSSGYFSFITSNTFINNKDFLSLRKFLLKNVKLNYIVNLGETVFKDANLDVAILAYQKKKIIEDHKIQIIKNRFDFDNNLVSTINQKLFESEINNYEFKINACETDFVILRNIYLNSKLLEEILDLPRGIEIGGNSDLIGADKEYPILVGRNIDKYLVNFNAQFIDFDFSNKSTFKDFEIYAKPKLLIQRIRNLSLHNRIIATYDESGFICTNTLRIGLLKNKKFNLKYLLSILNSKLINYLFLKFFLNKDIYAYQLAKIPIKEIGLEKQKVFSAKTDEMLLLNSQLEELKNKFVYRISENIKLENISQKLQSFYESDFKQFRTELKKQKVELSLKQQDEWEEYFNEYKTQINQLQGEITKADNQIDVMVYKLYNLTYQEVEIIDPNIRDIISKSDYDKFRIQ